MAKERAGSFNYEETRPARNALAGSGYESIAAGSVLYCFKEPSIGTSTKETPWRAVEKAFYRTLLLSRRPQLFLWRVLSRGAERSLLAATIPTLPVGVHRLV